MLYWHFNTMDIVPYLDHSLSRQWRNPNLILISVSETNCNLNYVKKCNNTTLNSWWNEFCTVDCYLIQCIGKKVLNDTKAEIDLKAMILPSSW